MSNSDNQTYINPETLEFMEKVKNDQLNDMLILRVESNGETNRYAMLTKGEYRIDLVNKSSIYNQLKNTFEAKYEGSIFSIKMKMIDDYIRSVLSITSHIYKKAGFVKVDSTRYDYNYIVLTPFANRVIEEAEKHEKRDLMEVYNERKHLFPKMDLVIDNLLSVNSNVNIPLNKQGIDLKHHFLNHQAFAFQQYKKSGTFYMLRTVPGAGKGVFALAHEEFFGSYMVTVQPEIFLGTGFNATIDGKRFVILNEFKTTKRNREEMSGRVKSFITDEKDRIRGMHKELEITKQVSNAIMFLNFDQDLAIDIEAGCRRTNIIESRKTLIDAIEDKLMVDIKSGDYNINEDFIPELKKELFDFVLTLFLAEVNIGLATNVTIDNEAKRKAQRVTSGRNRHLRDVILSGDLDTLDNYFLDVIDTVDYKILKSQIKIGFIDNKRSGFLYEILSEYDPQHQKNIKAQMYMDNVLGLRNTEKYTKRCGTTSSVQIRKLDYFKKEDFLNYMALFKAYEDGDQSLEEAMFGDLIVEDDLLSDNIEFSPEVQGKIEEEVANRVADVLDGLNESANQKYKKVAMDNKAIIEAEVERILEEKVKSLIEAEMEKIKDRRVSDDRQKEEGLSAFNSIMEKLNG